MLDVSPENLPQKVATKARTRGTLVLRSVLHTLAYADIFDYPLTVDEVYRYLASMKASRKEVVRVLADETLFTPVQEYFTLRGREKIVETRRRRAGFSARLWVKAARYARIIAMLPFVRMVAITGSLAMNNADEGKDVDYMIVTAPKRLWTCRALSLLIARFAKLEGVNLCPNYLVTTNALEMKERSLYVAHELAQMIPLSGIEIYHEVLRLNSWLGDYLPNALMQPELPQGIVQVERQSFFQKILEVLFRFPLVDRFEHWEMNRKIERLNLEQASSSESYFSADVCKGHIDRHGETVVMALAIRLQKADNPQGAP